MNDKEAHDVLRQAETAANGLLRALVRMTTPDVAITALGLVAGTVFASLEIEDNKDTDELFNDWLLGVKMQYKDTLEEIKKSKQ